MIRRVRATSDFFADIDRQLPDERGPNGEPSRGDFQTYDLLEIVDRFGNNFDDLPELIEGRPEYRLLVARGRLVAAVSVSAQLASDGTIELVSIEIDHHGLPQADED